MQTNSYGRYQNRHKLYVKVRADHEIGGKVVPIMFKLEEGDAVRIDRILDVRQAAATKAGGQGTRYLCQVMDREVFLFHDRDDWFIEIN